MKLLPKPSPCPKCHDAGGLTVMERVDSFGEVPVWVPCDDATCIAARERAAREATASAAFERLLLTGIPHRFASATLADKPRPGQEGMWLAARALAARDPIGERGLLLCGGVRLGKSHAMAALLRSLHERGVSCVWENWSELLLKLRASFNAPPGKGRTLETEKEIHDRLAAANVLFLDDLGADKRSDFSDAALYLVVNARYQSLRPIVASSNFKGDDLGERLGARIYSRLKETAEVVEL